MQRRHFLETTATGVLGLGSGLLLPGSAWAQPARQKAGTLTIGSNSAVNTLDPAKAGNGDPIALFYEVAYDSLVSLMPDGTYGPGLATEFGYTDSKNKVFELKLRAGVKFSDGEALTAEGVKAFWDYYGKARGPMANRVKYFESVEVTGPLSLRIRLAKSNPILPYYFMQRAMMGAIVSPRALKNPDALGTTTAGAGPYMLDPKQTVTGQNYVYVRNPNYWNPKAQHWNTVVIRVIEDPNAMLSAMQAGQVDYAMGTPRTAAAAASAGFDVYSAPDGFAEVQFIDRNGEKFKPLSDIRVRRALSHAIRRNEIAKALFGKSGQGNDQLTVPGGDGWTKANVDYYPYDLEKAKSLMAQAGYANGFTLPMICSNLQPNQAQGAQAIAAEWSRIGVKVDLQSPSSFNEFVSSFANYPAMQFHFGNSGAWNMVDQTHLGWGNPFKVQDKVIDELFEQVSAEPNRARQQDLYAKLLTRHLELAWRIPYATFDRYVYARPGLAGVHMGPGLDPNPVWMFAKS